MKGKNIKKKPVVSNVDKDKEKLLFKQQLDFASDIFKKYCGNDNNQNENLIENKPSNINKKNNIKQNIKIKSYNNNNNNKKGQTQGHFNSKNKISNGKILENNESKPNKSQNNFQLQNQLIEEINDINLLIAQHNANIDKENQLKNHQIIEEENILNIKGVNNEINIIENQTELKSNDMNKNEEINNNINNLNNINANININNINNLNNINDNNNINNINNQITQINQIENENTFSQPINKELNELIIENQNQSQPKILNKINQIQESINQEILLTEKEKEEISDLPYEEKQKILIKIERQKKAEEYKKMLDDQMLANQLYKAQNPKNEKINPRLELPVIMNPNKNYSDYTQVKIKGNHLQSILPENVIQAEQNIERYKQILENFCDDKMKILDDKNKLNNELIVKKYNKILNNFLDEKIGNIEREIEEKQNEGDYTNNTINIDSNDFSNYNNCNQYYEYNNGDYNAKENLRSLRELQNNKKKQPIKINPNNNYLDNQNLVDHLNEKIHIVSPGKKTNKSSNINKIKIKNNSNKKENNIIEKIKIKNLNVYNEKNEKSKPYLSAENKKKPKTTETGKRIFKKENNNNNNNINNNNKNDKKRSVTGYKNNFMNNNNIKNNEGNVLKQFNDIQNYVQGLLVNYKKEF